MRERYGAEGADTLIAALAYKLLNRNLNVPCGWARLRIAGPNSSTRPFPTGASIATTPPSRYCCPHDQPLRSGVFESNQAMAFSPCDAAAGPSLKTGLFSKNTSVRSIIPCAIGCDVSMRACRTDPGV